MFRMSDGPNVNGVQVITMMLVLKMKVATLFHASLGDVLKVHVLCRNGGNLM